MVSGFDYSDYRELEVFKSAVETMDQAEEYREICDQFGYNPEAPVKVSQKVGRPRLEIHGR